MSPRFSLRQRWTRLRAWAHEIDYARQRMMELKTGYAYSPETRRRRAQAEIDDLNKLFTDDTVS